MRVANNSQINFSGIEIISSQSDTKNTQKVLNVLEKHTLNYTNSLLSRLEKEASADILIKVTPEGKMDFNLVRKYCKHVLGNFGDVLHNYKTIPLIDTSGENISTVIDTNTPIKDWMPKFKNFLRKCKIYLDNPDNPQNRAIEKTGDYIRIYDLHKNISL